MASVRKLDPKNPNSKWVVEYTDAKGKRRRKTPKGAGLKKDAEALRKQIERELGDRSHVAASETVTFEVATEAYLRDCDRRHKVGDLTGATLYGYVSKSKNVVRHLGHLKLTAVDALAVQTMINELSLTAAKGSLSAYRMMSNQVLKYAVRNKWLIRNPLVDQGITLPKNAAKKDVRCPSRAEMVKLIETMEIRAAYEQPHARENRKLIVILGLFVGLRRGEMGGLRWQDVDFKMDVIRVRHSMSRHDGLKCTKTPSGVRVIPMPPMVRKILQASPQPDGFVLRNRDGDHMCVDNIGGAAWEDLLIRAGLVKPNGKKAYTLHEMRHGAISLLISMGVPPLHIKVIAGHSRIATTMDIYGHLFPEDDAIRKAMQGMADFVPAGALTKRPDPTMPPKGREAWIATRTLAFQLLSEGVQPIDVAAQLSVSHAVIKKWQAEERERDILLLPDATQTRHFELTA